ncbi:hypothetical protein P3W45_000506 [Vairimorpha bombi]
MEEEIRNLTSRILELEEELENKEIMINVLINEVKRNKVRSEDIKRRKKNENVDDVTKWNSEPKIIEESFINKSAKELLHDKPKNQDFFSEIIPSTHKQEPEKEKEEISTNWIYKFKLKDDLENMFSRKKVMKIFKDNVFIDEFVDFCAETYLIKSFDEIFTIIHAKNVKKYLQDNKTKITKYVIQNINKLSMSSICSTLLCLSTEFTDDEKLVIIHDIILYVQDNSRILFAVFCILNTEKFFSKQDSEDIFRNTISSILCHQYTVDIDIHKNRKVVVGPLSTIRNILGLKASNKNIEDVLLSINSDIPVFCKYKINPEIYKYMYSVRVLGHFLDWDYCYNVYIREYLSKEVNGCKILYLGLLTLNSLRLFGNIESTEVLFSFILENMKGSDELSLISYLIIKQINEKDSKEYIERVGKDIENIGYDLEYLKKLIVY